MTVDRSRINRLAVTLPEQIDALLVTNPVNVRYLSGFTGSNGALLVPRDGAPVIATDGRYLTQVSAESPELECIADRDVAAALMRRSAADGITRLGIEAHHVTVALHRRLAPADAASPSLVPVDPLVEPLRAVKDEAELAALSQACAITDAAFAEITRKLRPGVSERDVAWQLQVAIHEHGGDGLAFESIVAFGANTAIPHHQPTGRLLEAGDLVKLDFGAMYDGYRADMTRTVAVSPVADWQRELHALVHGVQAAARAATVVGALPRELDAITSAAIEASGHRVAHGLGHGVGLEIHELPMLVAGSASPPLLDRMPVTIEPGVYLQGRGGVRIEDTVVLGASGATPLTTSPRELIEL